jgi:hypothetical protein
MRFPTGHQPRSGERFGGKIFRRSAARFASLSAVHALAGVATVLRPSGPEKPAGVSLAIHLRTHYPLLKIMGMSAAPSSGDKFIAAGLPFIEKPFHYAELIARLRERVQ